MPQLRDDQGRFLPNPNAPSSGVNFGAGSPFTLQSAMGNNGAGFSVGGVQVATSNVATQGILDGLQSVATRAYSVGANIGQSLLQGFLSPFGRTGSAIGSIAGSAISAGQTIAGNGIGIAGGALGVGAQIGLGAAMFPLHLAGGLASAAGGMAGGALGVGGAVLGGIGSLIGMATDGITHLFQFVINGVTGLISKISDGLGALGELAGSIFKSALDIASDVLSEAANIGRTVRSLAFNTGTSEATAGKAVNAFSFAGVSPQATQSLYSQPMAGLTIGMRARMLGLPDPTTDPEGFLIGGANARAQAAKGGMAGAAMFQAQLGPQLNGAFGDAFSLGPDRLRQQMSMARAFQLPGNVGQLGGDVESAQNIIGAFARNAKITLAEVLLPLAPILTRAFSWMIENREGIVSAITTAGQWLFIEMPKMVLHGGAFTLRALGSVMDSLGKFLVGGWQDITARILTNLPDTLKGFDEFLNGMRSLASVSMGLASAMMQMGENALQSPLGQAAAKAMGLAPSGGGGGKSGGNSSSTSGFSLPGEVRGSATGAILAVAGGLRGAAEGAVGLGPAAVSALNDFFHGNARKAAGDLWDAGTASWRKGFAGMKAGWKFGNDGPADMSNSGTSPDGLPSPGMNGMPGVPSTNGMMPVSGRSVADAYRDGQNWFLGKIPASNIAGQESNIADIIKASAKHGKNAGQWMLDNKDGVNDTANSLDKLADKWGSPLDRIANAAEATARNTDQSLRLENERLKAQIAGDSRLVARASAFISEDATMNILHG